MSHNKSARLFFYFSPVMLIAIVFTVTYIFHFFLEPLYLVIPLLITYYSYIWLSILAYNHIFGSEKKVFAKKDFIFHVHGFAPWMYFWIFAYPFLAGGFVFYQMAPHISAYWILGGIPFSLINGPSEETFWRLFLERCGVDAGLSKQTRLWYSSAIFSSWHFIFIIFLFPAQQIPFALIMTLGTTFFAGLLWMIVYQKTGTIIHNYTSHVVLNFLMICPWAVASVLGVNSLPF